MLWTLKLRQLVFFFCFIICRPSVDTGHWTLEILVPWIPKLWHFIHWTLWSFFKWQIHYYERCHPIHVLPNFKWYKCCTAISFLFLPFVKNAIWNGSKWLAWCDPELHTIRLQSYRNSFPWYTNMHINRANGNAFETTHPSHLHIRTMHDGISPLWSGIWCCCHCINTRILYKKQSTTSENACQIFICAVLRCAAMCTVGGKWPNIMCMR